MLAERRTPAHEYYVAVLNDRVSQGVVLVASSQGGMNIEEVAAKDPEAIITTPIDYVKGLSKMDAINVARKLGFKDEKTQSDAADIFLNLYKLFKDKDATQIEINPMALTTDGAVLWYVPTSQPLPLLHTAKYGCKVWIRRQCGISSARRLRPAGPFPRRAIGS
jgi:succinyl-CoA synthetase beta subunit